VTVEPVLDVSAPIIVWKCAWPVLTVGKGKVTSV
jgi:hypothetical protein